MLLPRPSGPWNMVLQHATASTHGMNHDVQQSVSHTQLHDAIVAGILSTVEGVHTGLHM